MNTILIRSSTAPVVEIDNGAGAVYVRFRPSKTKIAKTILQSEWPHVTIDLDAAGEVIGVEALGMNEFTIRAILMKAKLEAPPTLLDRARYFPTKQARYTPIAA